MFFGFMRRTETEPVVVAPVAEALKRVADMAPLIVRGEVSQELIDDYETQLAEVKRNMHDPANTLEDMIRLGSLATWYINGINHQSKVLDRNNDAL